VPALPNEPHFPRVEALKARRDRIVRRRRRLRREVKVAAMALIFALPTSTLLLSYWPAERPGRSLVAAIPASPEFESNPDDPAYRPLVTISLEPAAGERLPDFTPPVVRPSGFLLPDRGPEEPAHAGG
jgi:hypothetical protein